MLGPLRGEDVTVLRPVHMGEDADGDEVVGWVGEVVGDVLVSPAGTESLAADGRPHATRATLALHFPKTFSGSLRGCRVVVGGETLAIVGDPRPYAPALCPGPWWLTAEAVACDG